MLSFLISAAVCFREVVNQTVDKFFHRPSGTSSQEPVGWDRASLESDIARPQPAYYGSSSFRPTYSYPPQSSTPPPPYHRLEIEAQAFNNTTTTLGFIRSIISTPYFVISPVPLTSTGRPQPSSNRRSRFELLSKPWQGAFWVLVSLMVCIGMILLAIKLSGKFHSNGITEDVSYSDQDIEKFPAILK